MQLKILGYSLKNIPVSGATPYMKKLIAQTEKFLVRARWKALRHERPELFTERKETFGFKTHRAPERMKRLEPFEKAVCDLICNVKFKHRRNPFQRKLLSDVREIQQSGEVLIKADKTTNLYSMDVNTANKLVMDNITKTYKKINSSVKKDIDMEGKRIAMDLDLAERMEIIAERDCFITLKDHKPEFATNPTCRLINPTRDECGIPSRATLQRINTQIRAATGFQQWRSTQNVLDWFSKLPDRNKRRFIKFDIVDFYPSITENLLLQALDYAREIVEITPEEELMILHCRKSLLFSKGQAWSKKEGENFDVTMGSYDGAEVCELVGLFLLSKITERLPKVDGLDIVGLYRDDGLGAPILTNRLFDKARKDLVEIFKRYGLRITVETALPKTDFLDVVLDLPSGSYWPYRKPNNTPLYINAQSNHPPRVIKNLPKMIGKRLSTISCDQNRFDEAKPLYQDALRYSGYSTDLEYEPPVTPNPEEKAKRTRKRKTTWYNPPFDQNVSTNIGKKFLALVSEHFPPGHAYRKLFNRNNVKVSYCTMPNMASIISSHNSRVSAPTPPVPQPEKKTCNCRRGTTCPLNGNCLESSVVYKATVTAPRKPERYYFGLSEPPFKQRYNGHTYDFRHESERSSTTLAGYIWDLKDEGVEFDIKWEVHAKAAPYQCGSRRCDLCLAEKVAIASGDPVKMLNSRSELVSTCRHAAKFRYSSMSPDNFPT